MQKKAETSNLPCKTDTSTALTDIFIVCGSDELECGACVCMSELGDRMISAFVFSKIIPIVNIIKRFI